MTREGTIYKLQDVCLQPPCPPNACRRLKTYNSRPGTLNFFAAPCPANTAPHHPKWLGAFARGLCQELRVSPRAASSTRGEMAWMLSRGALFVLSMRLQFYQLDSSGGRAPLQPRAGCHPHAAAANRPNDPLGRLLQPVLTRCHGVWCVSLVRSCVAPLSLLSSRLAAVLAGERQATQSAFGGTGVWRSLRRMSWTWYAVSPLPETIFYFGLFPLLCCALLKLVRSRVEHAVHVIEAAPANVRGAWHARQGGCRHLSRVAAGACIAATV